MVLVRSMSMSSSSKRWAPATEMPSVSSPARRTARRSVSRSSDPAAASRTLWPSSSSSSSGDNSKKGKSKSSVATLADHLAKDDTASPVPHSLSRQRSCTERPRLAQDADDARKIGRSMRFLPSTKPAGVTLTPGRVAPSNLRRLALVDDAASSVGSECTDAASPRTTVSSKPRSPRLLPRTSSVRLLGSSTTQWALSPGRRTGSSSPLLNTTTTLPTTEASGNNVKKTTSLISLGWGHLFHRRKHANLAAAAATLLSSSPRNSGGETGRQVRMAHCRLLQWRFATAREDAVGRRKAAAAELQFMGAWASVSEMTAKVARNRLQLQREKLRMKLNAVLSSQMKYLESWEHMETNHASALASTVACTRAAVCRIPLTNAAKVSVPSLASTLQHALELVITAKTTTRPFSPMALETTSVVTELVRVAREEQALLQDCLELLGRFSALQLEEQSLRCHLVQSSSSLTSVTVE